MKNAEEALKAWEEGSIVYGELISILAQLPEVPLEDPDLRNSVSDLRVAIANGSSFILKSVV